MAVAGRDLAAVMMEASWVNNDPVKIIESFRVFFIYGLGLGAPDPQLPLIFKSWFSQVTRPYGSSVASSIRTPSVALLSQDLFSLCSSALNPTSPRCDCIPLASHRS